MKTLLFMKAAVEILAGLALIAFPSVAVSLVMGQPLTEPVGIVIGRIAGVAVLALGITCWLARNESQSHAAISLIWALLFYDVSFVLILLSAHLRIALDGIGLWLVVALHSGLGVWSALCLGKVMHRAVAQ